MKIIQELAELIDFKNAAHKVDLKNPKQTILLEVIKGLCCISLLPDYFKLKKYNIFELTQTKKEELVDDEKPDVKPSDEPNDMVGESKSNENDDEIVASEANEGANDEANEKE